MSAELTCPCGRTATSVTEERERKPRLLCERESAVPEDWTRWRRYEPCGHVVKVDVTTEAEDVEELAKVLSGAPEFAARAAENHMTQARRLLASDWLAALLDAARRDGAAAVRDDIQSRRREFRRLNADPQYLNALDDAYGLAANRARESR